MPQFSALNHDNLYDYKLVSTQLWSRATLYWLEMRPVCLPYGLSFLRRIKKIFLFSQDALAESKTTRLFTASDCDQQPTNSVSFFKFTIFNSVAVVHFGLNNLNPRDMGHKTMALNFFCWWSWGPPFQPRLRGKGDGHRRSDWHS